MDPGGTQCPAWRDKPDIWEMMRDQYEDRTASLQAKEDELRQKISQMESLLSNQLSMSCCCASDTSSIPKIFPKKMESPVRDIPTTFREEPPLSCAAPCLSSEGVLSNDNKSSSRQRSTERTASVRSRPQSPSRSLSPKKSSNSPTFFQKVMENAKSILTLKCSSVHPTLDERPTRENDVTYSSNLKQKKSTCSCDEESTRNDCTTDSYSQDVTNSFGCKPCCPLDNSMITIKSKRTTSVVVNTCSYCNTSTSTDVRRVSEDASQVDSDYSDGNTQTISMDSCWVCPSSKVVQKIPSKKVDTPKQQQSCTKKTCSSYLSVEKRLSSPNVTFKNKEEPEKKQRCKSQIKEVDIQCAFIGSPILNKSDYVAAAPQSGQGGDGPCCRCRSCPAREDTSQNTAVCRSNNPLQKDDLNTVAAVASKEKQIKNQMEHLQNREKNYDALFNNYQNMVSSPTCCCTRQIGQSDRIDKISQELRLENKVLKDDLMQMKMELKHCLEKVEGPMKSQLNTEKMRCVQLEQELSLASQNMVNNQDTHLREMSALKVQLCMACSNINELNSINRRLKDEMASLDGMCARLEDDLIKQKISEAETIKRLTKRRGDSLEGTCTCSRTGVQEKVSCDSNLHVIARKLSRTLRESEPCEECANLPSELTGAAKVIKDLSDLVESRKVKRLEDQEESRQQKRLESVEARSVSREGSVKVASSQAPPETMDEGSQCMEGQRGDEAKTKTLMAAAPVEKELSSEVVVIVSTMEPATSEFRDRPPVESTYFSAAGEPLAMCPDICATCPSTCDKDGVCQQQGKPCLVGALGKPQEKELQKLSELELKEISKEDKDVKEAVVEDKESKRIPTEVEEAKKLPVEDGDIKKYVEKPSEKDTSKPTVLKTLEPPVCTEPCGSDQPCAMGQPCFIIKGREGQLQEKQVSETPKLEGLVIEPISVEAGEGIKLAPDAVIEIPSKVEELVAVKEVTEETALKAGEVVQAEPSAMLSPEAEVGAHLEEESRPVVTELKPPDEAEVFHETSQFTPPATSLIQIPEEEEKTVEPYQAEKVPEVSERLSLASKGSIPAPSPTGDTAESIKPTPAPSPIGDTAERIKPSSISEPSTIPEPSETPIKASITEPSAVKRTSSSSKPGSVAKASVTSLQGSITEPSAVKKPASLTEPSVTPLRSPITEPSSVTKPTEVAELNITPTESPTEPSGMAQPTFTPTRDSITELSAITEPGGDITVPSAMTQPISTPARSAVGDRSSKEKPSVITEPSATVAEPISTTEPITGIPSGLTATSAMLADFSSIPALSETVEESIADIPIVSKAPPPAAEETVFAPPISPRTLAPPISPRMLPPPEKVTTGVPYAMPTFVPGSHPFKEERTGDFPFEVDTKVEILDAPPSDLHVTTTITDSGTLEVITEGPAGVIETTMIYEPDGTITVVTHVTEEEFSNINGDKTGSTQLSPSSKATTQPLTKDMHLRMQPDESFMSGATDLTGLETVTESTKETTYLSSFVSDFEKSTVAPEHTFAESSTATMGSAFGNKFSAMEQGAMEGNMLDVPVPEAASIITGRGKMECCEEDRISRIKGDVSTAECCEEDRISRIEGGISTVECCEEDRISRTEGGFSTAECCEEDRISGKPLIIKDGVSTAECCEEDKLSRLEDGTSTMECCLEAIQSQVGGEASYIECCQEGTDMTEGQAKGITGKGKKSELGEEELVGISDYVASEDVVGEQDKRMHGDADTGIILGEQVEAGGIIADKTTQQALTDQKRDCGCQATPQAEQSCQCCECKDVGVSTSKDIETITDENMVRANDIISDQRISDIQELDSEARLADLPADVSQTTRDFAEAIDIDSGLLQATADEVSTIREGTSIQDQDALRKDSKDTKTPKEKEYKTKRGKSVRNRGTACICPDESDEESEKVPTTDRAAQCECYGPVETDDRSEGRLSSSSDTDHEKPSKKKDEVEKRATEKRATEKQSFEPDDIKKQKPKKKVESLKSQEPDFDESRSYPEHDTKKEKRKNKIDSSKSEENDFDVGESSVQSPTKKDKPKSKIHPVTSERGDSEEEGTSEAAKKEKPKKKSEPRKSEKDDQEKAKPSPAEKTKKKAKVIKSATDDLSLSSGTDTEYKTPEKTKSLEVPDSAIIPTPSTADSNRPRKKRSSLQKLQNIECDCPGVCQCVICSPKIIAERRALTGSPAPLGADQGRPCWCKPQPTAEAQVQRSERVVEPLHQVAKSYTQEPPIQRGQHPTGCQCINCLCDMCTPCPPQFSREAFLRSTNLTSSQTVPPNDRKRIRVDDVFESTEDILTDCVTRTDCRKTGRDSHPPNCECVDCLCLPKIRKIAALKEHPIIRDEKQVYQVKCYCENTRKPKSASRIPVATNSATGPPKVRASVSCTCGDCKCSPCSDINKASSKNSSSQNPPTPAAERSAPIPTGVRMTPSEIAKLCDCQDCQCRVCFDKPIKVDGAKGANKNCCCGDNCTCQTCPMEQLAKAALGTESSRAVSPATVSGHPEDCDCADCFCPQASIREKKETKIKVTSSKVPVKASNVSAVVAGKPSGIKLPGCTCGDCECPGKDAALQATGDKSHLPSDCNCPVCSCAGNEILKAAMILDQSPPMPVIPEGSPITIADCDCVNCQCNPCADPKRRKPDAVFAVTPCDCPVCNCDPCADPSKRDKGSAQKMQVKESTGVMVTPPGDTTARTASAGVGSTENQATHALDCICDECLCEPEEKHAAGCSCPECKCIDCYWKRTDIGVHAEGCQCDECLCATCDKKYESKAKVTVESGSGEEKPTVQDDSCSCEDCTCEYNEKSTIKSRSGERKTAARNDNCTCDDCTCVDCEKGVQSDRRGCTCADCLCIDCPEKAKAAGDVTASTVRSGPPTTQTGSPTQTGPPTHTCHCIDCMCDVCIGKSSPKTESRTGHDNCTCVKCVCDICSGSSSAKKETTSPRAAELKGCTCEVCQCSDCGNSRALPETTGKQCTCSTCQCADCPGMKGEELAAPVTTRVGGDSAHVEDCICDKCVCEEEIARSGPVQASSHAENCTCDKCTCEEEVRVSGPVQEQQAATTVRAGISPLTDPPPFEVPIRKPCTCNKCDCPDCNNEYAISPTTPAISGTASRISQPPPSSRLLGVVPPATAEAPPFVVPVHIPCTCGRCDCSDCNKLAGIMPQPSSGVPPTVSFAYSQQPSGVLPIASIAQSQQLSGVLPTASIARSQQPSGVGAAASIARSQQPSGVAAAASIARSQQPFGVPVCTCGDCSCRHKIESMAQPSFGITSAMASLAPSQQFSGVPATASIAGSQQPCGIPPTASIGHSQQLSGVATAASIARSQQPSGVAAAASIAGSQQPCGIPPTASIGHSQQLSGVATTASIAGSQQPCGVPPTASIGYSQQLSGVGAAASIARSQQPSGVGAAASIARSQQPSGVPPSISVACSEQSPGVPVCTCGECSCRHKLGTTSQPSFGITSAMASLAPSQQFPGVPATASLVPSQQFPGVPPIASIARSQQPSGVPPSVSFALSQGATSQPKSAGITPSAFSTEIQVIKLCKCQTCECTQCIQETTDPTSTSFGGPSREISVGVSPSQPITTSVGISPSQPVTTSIGVSPSRPTTISVEVPRLEPNASIGVSYAQSITPSVGVSFGVPEPLPPTVSINQVDAASAARSVMSTAVRSVVSTAARTVTSTTARTVTSTMTKCNCPTCTCSEDVGKGVVSATRSTAGNPLSTPVSLNQINATTSAAHTVASIKTATKCDCPTCTCAKDADKGVVTSVRSGFPSVANKSTGLLNKEIHSADCCCPKCCMCEAKVGTSQIRTNEINEQEIIDISKMDNESLMKKIRTDKQENCKCKEQIKEIRRALDKIKCSCTEAEMKAIRSTTGVPGKPFVKQASKFGQTMSGLKFALNNLQEKCKAKDKLIETMTGELKMRTSSNTFDNVLDIKADVDAPDYDKADDVKSFIRSPQNDTNILFAANDEKEIGHTNVRQKPSDFTGHRHKKKSKTCKCGKQHKDKDNSNVDLSGFEVVDIRRITQDSIIIKWKPPQSNLVNGYDIFVNGVNKSKVMSGGRTSAMVHSLDLSSTIQITIYAVTKCGRCEPPAIAIYEINT